MGMEFPKRDTDSPNVEWRRLPSCKSCGRKDHPLSDDGTCWECWDGKKVLPTAADLDAVGEEQRVKEKTGANRSD